MTASILSAAWSPTRPGIFMGPPGPVVAMGTAVPLAKPAVSQGGAPEYTDIRDITEIVRTEKK